MHIIDWGMTHYEDALNRQKIYLEQRIQKQVPDGLFFTEHFPVYTVGRRLNAHQNLLISPEICAQKNISIIETNRGGDITYHNPGQLVIYPIIDWSHHRDLHQYLRLLESITINTLQHFDIHAHTRENKTGIWVENNKIAAIGIAVKQWVVYHGIAININNDLSGFQNIIPCGIKAKEGGITSIQQLILSQIDLQIIKNTFILEFCKIFRQK